MQEELFEVLDEIGKVIGLRKRSEVHAKGLKHRAVDLLIFDGKGNVFIQERAKNKDVMPLKWDFSVAEHLKPGESYPDAAVRGAKEELGIKVQNPKLIAEFDFYFKYSEHGIDNEVNQLFFAELLGSKKGIKFKDKEVRQGKFIGLKELLKQMEEKPEKFTPWFLGCRKYLEAAR